MTASRTAPSGTAAAAGYDYPIDQCGSTNTDIRSTAARSSITGTAVGSPTVKSTCFKIQEVYHGIENRVKTYAFTSDTLKVKPFLAEKIKYKYHLTKNGETVTYLQGDDKCYTINQTDSILFYQKNKRKKAELKLGQGQVYSINTRDDPETFAHNDRSIVLSSKYRFDYHENLITFSRTYSKRSVSHCLQDSSHHLKLRENKLLPLQRSRSNRSPSPSINCMRHSNWRASSIITRGLRSCAQLVNNMGGISIYQK